MDGARNGIMDNKLPKVVCCGRVHLREGARLIYVLPNPSTTGYCGSVDNICSIGTECSFDLKTMSLKAAWLVLID